MTLSETVRDLKYKILEKLTCFGLEHIQLMCAGKQLYNEEKTLFEFRVKDDAEVMVMENEFGGEFDVQADMMYRHKNKCDQVKSMFSEEDDKLISYILLLKGESVE
jgi:ubiquitin C-terminal hydrolase